MRMTPTTIIRAKAHTGKKKNKKEVATLVVIEVVEVEVLVSIFLNPFLKLLLELIQLFFVKYI